MTKEPEPMDEISGVFDNATPEDFINSLVAPDLPEQQDAVIVESFRDFVQINLRTARIAYYAADGDPNMLCILGGPELDFSIHATDEETIEEFLGRVKRIAHDVGARWVFFARKTEMVIETGDQPVTDSAEPVMSPRGYKLSRGKRFPALYFYAASVEGLRSHGFMKVIDAADLETARLFSHRQPAGLFDEIFNVGQQPT